MSPAESHRRAVRDGLGALGVRRLVFGIHDASFPSGEEDDRTIIQI